MLRWKLFKKHKNAQSNNLASGSLKVDLAWMQEALGDSPLFVFRQYSNGIYLVYSKEIVDHNIMNRDILALLHLVENREITPRQLPVGDILATTNLKQAAEKVLAGYTALFREGSREITLYNTRKVEKRSIEEPPTEHTTRGSRIGFVEDLETNLALLRDIVNTPTLTVEYFEIGNLAKNTTAIVYLKDVASPDVVGEVRHRLQNLRIDDVLSAGAIENHIEDHPWSLFPQSFGTEKSNRVVANLMEGRVAIMAGGTPYVLLVPALFLQFLQGPEDYFDRFWVANFTRLLRFLGLFISAALTPIYISLVTYHHELLPLDLMLAIAEHRRQAPFPPIIEALFMELVIEILREAGLRLPSPLGQTLGVVGGIVLGQAIVSAKIVGPLVIIVVAVSAISSFIIPNYSASLSIRLAKYPLMLLAAMFGAFGISMGMILLITHQVSMQSFGVPYFAPIAPTRYQDLGDSFFLSHIWKMKKRPASIPHRKDTRIKETPQEHHQK